MGGRQVVFRWEPNFCPVNTQTSGGLGERRMEYTVKDKVKLEEFDARSDASEVSGEGFFWKSGELLGRSISSWLKLVLFSLLSGDYASASCSKPLTFIFPSISRTRG